MASVVRPEAQGQESHVLGEEKASGVECTVFAFTHVQPGRAASQGDPQIRGSYRPGRLPGYSLWPLCTHVRVC